MATVASDSRAPVVTAVCIAVAVLAVFGAMNSYQVSERFASQYPDTYGAGRAQIRFSPLLAKVPADARVGYITDLDPASDAYSAAFLAAQYALAPRQMIVVGKGVDPDVAIGNFSKPQDYASAGASRGFEMTDDLGNGVILFRRKQP